MKTDVILQKSDKELRQALAERRGALAKLQVESRTQKMANVRQIRQIKRTIARLLTIERQREITNQEKQDA